MTKAKFLPILALALAVPLAACSSNGSSTATSSTTTAAGGATTSAPAGSGSTGTTARSGSTGSSAPSGGSTAARGPACADVATSVPEAFADAVSVTGDEAGVCTLTLGSGDRIEVLWNARANTPAMFATITGDLAEVEVTGADQAVGGYDELGAQVKVLLDGKGAFEYSLTPEYVSARPAGQTDVDHLVALAAAVIAAG